MRKRYFVSVKSLVVLCVLVTGLVVGAVGCKKPQPAVISGVVINIQTPGAKMEGLSVAAVTGGQEMASSPVGAAGEYTIILAQAGTYDLRLKGPLKSVDFAFAIEAKAGETVTAPNIDIPVGVIPAPPPPPPPPAPEPQPVSVTPTETPPATSAK